MVDSSDSNTDCFEIRHHKSKTMKRKHDIDDGNGDEEISGTKAMLRRRKQPKNTMMAFSPSSKMTWTKSNELEIVRGIVDYEKEKTLSYRSDSDAFYGYVKDLVDADFSKEQLMNKVKKLKKKFTDNHERSKDVEGFSFANTDEEELFGLSMIIWGQKNETDGGSNENVQDQVPKDVPPSAENERESYTKMEVKKKSEEDGVDDLVCGLQDALEDDEDISGTEAMRSRRKRRKKTTMAFVYSPKMIWTKSNELDILRGIVDYEKEKRLSYRSDSAAFYGYVKDLVDADFSKEQLMNKVKKLKKKFTDNHERSKDVEGFSFANTDEEELFGLSMIIWGQKNETDGGSNDNVQDQVPKVLVAVEDVPPCAGNETEGGKKDETESGSNENMEDQVPKDLLACAENETEGSKKDETECDSNKNMQDQVPKDVVAYAENETEGSKKDETECDSNENMQDQVPKDVLPCAGNEQGSYTRVEKEKKSEEAGADDEFYGLQDALESLTFFKASSENLQNVLRRNLKNLLAQRRMELTDEWNALLDDELKLRIKKLAFSVKLANAGFSD